MPTCSPAARPSEVFIHEHDAAAKLDASEGNALGTVVEDSVGGDGAVKVGSSGRAHEVGLGAAGHGEHDDCALWERGQRRRGR